MNGDINDIGNYAEIYLPTAKYGTRW